PGNRIQDAAVTESMGPIYDRSKEHLGTTDVAVIHMRRELIRLARELQQGIEPPILSDPSRFRAIPMDLVTREESLESIWDPYWHGFKEEAGLAATPAS
ncbi:MAG TPA: hypothetical protein VFX19_10155, partial [Dehalococcoidia bacterium]|nr:hypothetical protein [Dehalococcoidia bacterium]